MTHTRLAAAISMAAFAAAGLGVGAGVAACGSTAHVPAATGRAAGPPGGPAYSYYRSMMGRLYSASGPSGMMGSTFSRSVMMGETGYRAMMGGLDAPAWMTGSALPGYMMGTSRDPGKVMGTLFANAPGTRVSPAQAATLGRQIPPGATASRTRHTITFSGTTVRLVVLASPAGGPDETFRIAGMVNPAITVKAGARVSIEVINADPDTAHGLVITAGQAGSSSMPMMTASPAFTGSAVWFLGDPTSAGMHAATLSFTASTPGTYRYLCPVPGHAQEGMTGTFTVSGN
jgi:rusticyanin